MSSYIEGTIPLYISQDQYNNFITKINNNKTNTSWIYINQLSNDIARDYDFTKYRLYKTLDDTLLKCVYCVSGASGTQTISSTASAP